jgi:glycerophosphoryl diester phosphodiesterase
MTTYTSHSYSGPRHRANSTMGYFTSGDPYWLGLAALAVLSMIAGFLAVVLGSGERAFAAAPADCGSTTIVSHKTGGVAAPENTTQGLKLAGSQGVKTAEIDIRFNKSNFAWATHEADISTTTNAPAGTLIENLWFGDVGKYSAADYAPWSTDPNYAGYLADGVTPKTKMPYTYEILDAAQKAGLKTLVLDVKVTPTADQISSFIGYMDRPEFVNGISKGLIWMGSAATVAAMKAAAPDRFTFAILDNPAADAIKSGSWITGTGATVYGSPNYRVDGPAVSYWEAYGISALTWTTNSAAFDTTAERRRLAAAGVAFLVTDYAAQARSEICGASLPAGAKRSK